MEVDVAGSLKPCLKVVSAGVVSRLTCELQQGNMLKIVLNEWNAVGQLKE